jgi:hypothetical protein
MLNLLKFVGNSTGCLVTSRQRFYALKKYIEDDDVTVEIDSTYYSYALTPEKDRIINGVAGSDSHIIIYKDSKDKNYNMMTSLLIHEYGHVLLWRDGKDRHSEKMAWKMGMNSVPEEFIPSTFNDDMAYCLSSYILFDRYSAYKEN